MRIINILEIINGIPSQIISSAIYEEQLSSDVVEDVEKLFIQMIEEKISPNLLSDDDRQFYLEEGSYDNKNGYELYIIWSNVD